jgi:phosphoribosyl-ATP pyrophosphohydrolase
MAKSTKKPAAKKAATKKASPGKTVEKKLAAKKSGAKKAAVAKAVPKKAAKKAARAVQPAAAFLPVEPLARPAPPLAIGAGPAVLDRLWAVVESRRNADPATSHSARLLSRGMGKVAQKFGEEAVECLIEAVAGNAEAMVGESADVLYHLLVMWVAAGVKPEQVWAELARREGVSGIAEKAARALPLTLQVATSKIP